MYYIGVEGKVGFEYLRNLILKAQQYEKSQSAILVTLIDLVKKNMTLTIKNLEEQDYNRDCMLISSGFTAALTIKDF